MPKDGECYIEAPFVFLRTMTCRSPFWLLLTCIFLLSCSKDCFITGPDARIQFSVDTLRFDTVFVSAGSTTRTLKILNPNNQKLRIESIELMGGSASSFRINVDGMPGPLARDLVLEAGDSLYVFATVNIQPNANNQPFIVQDSLRIQFNGNQSWVQLEAFGQNARYLRNARIANNTVWDAQLPYVILGPLQVDTNVTLTLLPGTQVYCSADAPILVDGTLRVQGGAAANQQVRFQGNRLDLPYREFPASWPGIYFRGTSRNNELQFAQINHAYQALVVQPGPITATPKLKLQQSIIHNSYDAGIYGIQTHIQADNCLISNCGKNLLLVAGGKYLFDHCTIASYGNLYLPHQDPVTTLTNQARINGIAFTAPLEAVFQNCIFWGEGGIVDDEFVVSKAGNDPFDVRVLNSLWKVKNTPSPVTGSNIIANQNPLFDSIDVAKQRYNFRLQSGSPALNKGLRLSYPFDLDNLPRVVGLPDLGAYESQ